MIEAEEALEVGVEPMPRAQGPLAEFWRSYAQNRGALIGLGLAVALVLIAIFAGVLAPHPPYEQYRELTLTPPAWQAAGDPRFVLGTDAVGRDILSRLIYGTRLSLLIGLISVAISLSLGIVLGMVAGYVRGWVEIAIMRLMDVMLALPSLLLAIAVVAILGPGLINAMYAIAIVLLPHYVRLARAAVIAEAGREYRRRRTVAPDVQHHPPELPRASDRAGHAWLLIRDPRRRGTRLPRAGRAAADAGVGLDAGGCARVHPARLVGRHLSRASDPRDGAGIQPDGRRPSGRARSEAPAMSPHGAA
jgi:hypothetical protein